MFLAVPFPPTQKLSIRDLFNAEGKINVTKLRDHLSQEGRLEDEVCL